MDSILFYGDRGEATRRQVRSAAASHSHRIGPRKAKASKKPKVEEQIQYGRKLEACGATTGKFSIDKTCRPATVSPPKAEDANECVKERVSRTESTPSRPEASLSPATSSLDTTELNGRLAPIRLDMPPTGQQAYTFAPLPPININHKTPDQMTSSPLLKYSPRSNPYQHYRHDSGTDPLVVTRILPHHTRSDPTRYERSFDGRLHLATSSTHPPSSTHCIPPALRVLPESKPFNRPTSQPSDFSPDHGMQTARRSSGSGDEVDRLRTPSAG